MTEPFVHIADAAEPVIGNIIVARAVERLDAVIGALRVLGALVERPVGELQYVRNLLAEHFGAPSVSSTAQQQDNQ